MKFIFTLTLALLLSSTSLASVNTVTNLLNSGPGSLRNTIANATSGDTIRFNPNLISAGNATIVLTSEIAFNKNLTIIGLYNATDTLFISGNNTNRIFHVDLSSSTIKTLVLDSVALINGKTSGDGGAIRFINGSALNIVNSFISKNQASKGAGVYSLSTISTIIKLEHSTINGNYGDGIYSTSATSSVTSTVQVRFSTISGNTGSGVYANTILESIVYLTNSRVSENNRNGVYSLSSTSRIIINNSMAIGNKQYGAFSYSYVSSPSTSSGRSGIKLINSTISGNTEAGIYSFSSSLFGSSVEVIRSTISGNKKQGINCSSSTSRSNVQIIYSTISGNEREGITSSAPFSKVSSIFLRSSIIANNGNINIRNNQTPTIGSLGYNILSESTISGSLLLDQLGVTPSQLNLGILRNNGGNTFTMMPNAGSVAIDMGNPSNFSNAQNGPITGGRRDVGAAERICVASTSIDTIISCDNYTWTDGKTYTTSNNTATDTLTNSVGCDSIITLNLTINNTNYDTVAKASCYSYLSPSGNYTWTMAGMYQDTILTTSGCDSIITIDLTINTTTYGSYSDTNCFSYTSPSGKYTWTSSGTYQDTIPNASGCDSVITLNLTINNTNYDTVAIASCNSYLSPSGNYTWTTAGMYQDTILTNAGCDSIITINLTINTTTYGSYLDTNCFSYTSPSGKYTWSTSGTYQDTILNTSGCDSVMTINLIILQNGSKTVTNFNDNGPGSLRDFASGFCSGDTIFFDPSTNGNPIVLTSGQIVIDKDVVIMGNDSASTIIDGNSLGRIFYIYPGVTVTISNIKLTNGKTKEGGAIYNRGNLTLDAVSLVNNKAQISNLGHTKGGAIYNKGRITITNSSLIGNSAITNGVSNSYAGAIFNWGTCIMTNCVAKGNSSVSFHGLVLAGVIYNHVDSKFELTNSQMIANEARTGYYGFGGAIVNRRGVVSTITNSSLIDNFAKSNGGAIHNLHFPNSITIVGGVLQGNQTENGTNHIGQGAFDIR